MAYKRSITSSDDDSTGPKFSKAHSDSSESIQSGCSAKYEGLFDYIGPIRRRGLPEHHSPSPEESSEDDKENMHPALQQLGEQAESEEEDTSRYPVYQDPPHPIEISDDSLESVIHRLEAPTESSYSGPPGFGASSSAAAALQHHLNVAQHRIEQLEEEVGQRQYAQGEVEAENVELADRVAQLSVGFVMMGMGTDAADRVNGSLWVAVVVLVVMVAALLVRGWL